MSDLVVGLILCIFGGLVFGFSFLFPFSLSGFILSLMGGAGIGLGLSSLFTHFTS